MIAGEIYEARRELDRLFPTLELRVVRSGHRYRTWVVGVTPKGMKESGNPVWIWTPMDGFPNDALRAQLMLIA